MRSADQFRGGGRRNPIAVAEDSLVHLNRMAQQTSARDKNKSAQNDSSSELIRWRADQLLDEMMLGAVDVSAADSSGSEGQSAVSSEAANASVQHGVHESREEESANYASHVPSPPKREGQVSYDLNDVSHPRSGVQATPNGKRAPETDVNIDELGSKFDNGPGAQLSGLGNGAEPIRKEQTVDSALHKDYNQNGNASGPDADNRASTPDTFLPEPKWMEDDWRSQGPEPIFDSEPADQPPPAQKDTDRSYRTPTLDAQQPQENSEQKVEQKSDNHGDGLLFSSALRSNLDDLRAPSLDGERFEEEDGTPDRQDPEKLDKTSSESSSTPAVSDSSASSSTRDFSSDFGRPIYENFPGERPTSGGGQSVQGTERRSWHDPTLPRVQSGGGLASEPRVGTASRGTTSGYRQQDEDASGASQHSGVSATETDESRDGSSGAAGVYASPMSVGSMSRKLRSTLLPRMSTLDVDSLNEEILALHEEIREILPIGHETAERARHLLDKAHTILHSDPMRSAEVEYYMQQVRAIVQRIRQTHSWSNLYRSRLQLYLTAWALLSLVVLVALMIFSGQFELFWMALTGLGAESALVHRLPVILATLLAGAMGGAIGALYTMYQHARREYGFFDRKYGLRGVMLPIIGAIFGGLLYGVFAGIAQLFGIASSGGIAFGMLPALLALAFGLGQESLYGTRS